MPKKDQPDKINNLKLKSKKSISINTLAINALIIFGMGVWLSISSPYFFTARNFNTVLTQIAIVGVLSIGQLFVIITGGIDLSVGMVAQLVNVILTILVVSGTPIPLAIAISLIVGICVGLINGILIYELGMPPFITTLGSMTVANGVSLLLTKGTNISGLPLSFANFGSSSFLGLPNLFWFFVCAIVIGGIILRFTKFGKYIYAIGSNVETVRLSGIDVRKVVYGVYAFSGLLAGIAGIMLTFRLWMGVPTCGINLNLDSIAAAALGGASLFGAQGSAIGVFLGAMIIAIIKNGSVLLNINPFWQQVIIGILIVLTVALDQIRAKGKYSFIRKF